LTCSGAAIWTAIIKQDEFINKVQVEGKKPLGIIVSSGPALCKPPSCHLPLLVSTFIY
jgi:hypothetical protein